MSERVDIRTTHTSGMLTHNEGHHTPSGKRKSSEGLPQSAQERVGRLAGEPGQAREAPAGVGRSPQLRCRQIHNHSHLRLTNSPLQAGPLPLGDGVGGASKRPYRPPPAARARGGGDVGGEGLRHRRRVRAEGAGLRAKGAGPHPNPSPSGPNGPGRNPPPSTHTFPSGPKGPGRNPPSSPLTPFPLGRKGRAATSSPPPFPSGPHPKPAALVCGRAGAALACDGVDRLLMRVFNDKAWFLIGF